MARARGYSPFETSPEQDTLLDQIVDHAKATGAEGVGVFDLDGCLFDTRPRWSTSSVSSPRKPVHSTSTRSRPFTSRTGSGQHNAKRRHRGCAGRGVGR